MNNIILICCCLFSLLSTQANGITRNKKIEYKQLRALQEALNLDAPKRSYVHTLILELFKISGSALGAGFFTNLTLTYTHTYPQAKATKHKKRKQHLRKGLASLIHTKIDIHDNITSSLHHASSKCNAKIQLEPLLPRNISHVLFQQPDRANTAYSKKKTVTLLDCLLFSVFFCGIYYCIDLASKPRPKKFKEALKYFFTHLNTLHIPDSLQQPFTIIQQQFESIVDEMTEDQAATCMQQLDLLILKALDNLITNGY